MVLLNLILDKDTPYYSFRACLLESYLREYLISRFDEQWWREIDAGRQLIKWWNQNSGLTTGFLEQEIETGPLNIKKLIKYFEKAF